MPLPIDELVVPGCHEESEYRGTRGVFYMVVTCYDAVGGGRGVSGYAHVGGQRTPYVENGGVWSRGLQPWAS